MRDLLLDALSTYRLTRLVTQDEITEGFRTAVAKWADDGPSTLRSRGRREKVVTLVNCPHCASVWLGFGVVLARRIAPKPWGVVAEALALSAVTGLVATREP